MSNPGVWNLKGYWKLDEESGVRVNSIPGNSSINLNAIPSVGFTGGRHNLVPKAAVMGSSNRLATVDANNLLRPGAAPFSMGIWIRPHDVATASMLIAKWGSAGDQEYILEIGGGATSKPIFFIYDSSYGQKSISNTSAEPMVNYKWYFITAYCNPLLGKIAVGCNNVWDIGTHTLAALPLLPTPPAFKLATWEGLSMYYEGEMQDAFFYNGSQLDWPEWSWLYDFGSGRRYADIVGTDYPPLIYVDTSEKVPEIRVYDSELNNLGVIDDYGSLNWTERYDEAGEFEVELPFHYSSSPLTNFGNFLYIRTSDKLMIIEDKTPSLEEDGKRNLLVAGRSAEVLLDRRVLLYPLTWYGSGETLSYILVANHIRNPTNSKRKITIFSHDESGLVWPPSMSLGGGVVEQWGMENSVYSIIEGVCKNNGVGFKIVVPNLEQFDTGGGPLAELYFYVYSGVNRSISQQVNDPVIFSENFSNILQASFFSSIKDNLNVVLVSTPDEVAALQRIFVWDTGNDYDGDPGEPTDLDRFEIVLDNTVDRDSNGDDVDDLTGPEVLALIEARGVLAVREKDEVGVFEGDFAARGTFTYGIDFILGDIVECIIHDNMVEARIIEIVRSYTPEGSKLYMTFDYLP